MALCFELTMYLMWVHENYLEEWEWLSRLNDEGFAVFELAGREPDLRRSTGLADSVR